MGLTRQKQQERFDFDRSIVSQQIVQRLDSVGAYDLADPLRECHQHWMVRRCNGCTKATKFWNRCDKSFCPNCQPKIARERADGIAWWAANLKQPKHVVLTCKNFPVLTKRKVKSFRAAFVRLRRSVFAKNWAGGCFSLEVTNEGNGWHLHLHALIDSPFINSAELAVRWGKLVGQEFAIVKVKDCRDGEYLREVTKYAVKGTDLARWQPEQIVEFIRAFNGVRTFGTFGTLYKRRAQFAEWLEHVRNERRKCSCGCDDFRLFSPDEWEWFELSTGCAPPSKESAPVSDTVIRELFDLQSQFPR